MTSPIYYFRSHILHCTTKWVGLLLLIYWFFAESKIYNNIAQKYIWRFSETRKYQKKQNYELNVFMDGLRLPLRKLLWDQLMERMEKSLYFTILYQSILK